MDKSIRRTSPLLINESPMQFLPSLACAVGVNGALFAQQLHYWLQDSRRPHWIDGRPWVYNTLEEWNLQFPFWSIPTIRRTITGLKHVIVNDNAYRILLTGHFSRNKLDHRCWYTLDYDELDRLVPVATLLLQKKQQDIANTSVSIRKNPTVYARQFPALASASEKANNISDNSRSDQNDQNDAIKTIKTMCSNRSKRSDQNDQNDVLKTIKTMCSNRSKRSDQNAIPTNNTIDYYNNRLLSSSSTSTAKCTARISPELARIFALYANNIDPDFKDKDDSIVAEKLTGLYDKYHAKWLEAAITEAVEATTKPNLKYIMAILERWNRDGFKVSTKKARVRKNVRNDRGSWRDIETPGLKRLWADMDEADRNAPRPWNVQQSEPRGTGVTKS